MTGEQLAAGVAIGSTLALLGAALIRWVIRS